MPMRGEATLAPLERALERLLSIVDPHVSLQVSFLCETFTASLEVALERFFSDLQ